MLKHFLHLDEIPRWFYQQNVPNAPWNEIYNPADEYNEIGSRYRVLRHLWLKIIRLVNRVLYRY